MDILKDIEKNILNINMYSKDNDQGKLNIIKKHIGDYFKYKSDENNIITQKMIIYDEQYKKAREINNYEYELFLQEKEERYNIYKETKELSSLYDYLNYKYTNNKSIPDIYTYEHIRLEERAKGQKEVKDTNSVNIIKDVKDAKSVKEKVCPEGKVLNPITKRCVKAPVAKKAKDVKKDPAEPKKDPAEPKKDPVEPKKDPAEPKKEPVEPKKDPAEPKKDPAEPKKDPVEPKKEPVEPKKEPKEKPKVPKEKPKKDAKVKECPEGKILNPVTNRCIKDVNYKPPKPPVVPDPS
jgi:hypothetical protein